jgi:hypothetical protein
MRLLKFGIVLNNSAPVAVLTFSFARGVFAGDGETAVFAAGEFAGVAELTGPVWFALLLQPAKQITERTISDTDRTIFLPFEGMYM